MPTLSLQAKKAYYAKTRKSNYAASLRLEGFESSPGDIERPFRTREEVLNSFRNKQV